MAKVLAVESIEDNLITFPEVSSELSDASPEPSQISQSEVPKALMNNPAAVAMRYGVSDRTIQNWVKRLVDECGIADSQLRAQHGNEVEYSAYCLDLLDDLDQYRKTNGAKRIAQWFSQLNPQPSTSKPSPTFTPLENHLPEPLPSGGGALAMWAPSAMAIAPTPSTGIEVLDGILDDCAEPPLEEVAIESSDQILEAIASLHQQVQSLEAQNEAEAEAIAQQRELLTKSAKALDALGMRKDQAVAEKRANQEEAQTVKTAQEELASVLGKLGLL